MHVYAHTHTHIYYLCAYTYTHPCIKQETLTKMPILFYAMDLLNKL